MTKAEKSMIVLKDNQVAIRKSVIVKFWKDEPSNMPVIRMKVDKEDATFIISYDSKESRDKDFNKLVKEL